jgi:hypothetical protein
MEAWSEAWRGEDAHSLRGWGANHWACCVGADRPCPRLQTIIGWGANWAQAAGLMSAAERPTDQAQAGYRELCLRGGRSQGVRLCGFAGARTRCRAQLPGRYDREPSQ